MILSCARLGLASLLTALLVTTPLAAQRELAGTAEIKLALDRLNVLGTVLMIAAHPDDENTTLLAYLARGRKLRTAYLAVTRGEGGQRRRFEKRRPGRLISTRKIGRLSVKRPRY